MKKRKSKNKWKSFWKKFWFIVWKDESLRGWIISILFIFIIIKFIFFPLMSLATGTALPLAIVESCSMYHEGNVFSNYDSWWNSHEKKYSNLQITKEKFKSFNFRNGFSKGDILFVIGAKSEKIKIGDVIIFDGGMKNPLIHRVIKIEEKNGEKIFSTIGDNNSGQLKAEEQIREDELIGKAAVRLVPSLGWGKLIFYEGLKPKSERGFCNEK